jgi:hypothetical protein
MLSFRRLSSLLLLWLTASLVLYAQSSHLTSSQAKDHVGEVATVCGKVVSTRFADRSRGQPTFLNLDAAYPNQIFTIVIWGNDRPKFEQPETPRRESRSPMRKTGKTPSRFRAKTSFSTARSANRPRARAHRFRRSPLFATVRTHTITGLVASLPERSPLGSG